MHSGAAPDGETVRNLEGSQPARDLRPGREIANKAEGLGFEALWFIDHQLGMKDVYAAMNVAAMATGSIGIGCAVTNLRTRHPTVTASATTALDELSHGRALLGLGAGWVAVHSIGDKPSRIAELREGIALFRKLFSGEEINFSAPGGVSPPRAGRFPSTSPSRSPACSSLRVSSAMAPS